MNNENPLEILSTVCDSIFNGINSLDQCLSKLELLLSLIEDESQNLNDED